MSFWRGWGKARLRTGKRCCLRRHLRDRQQLERWEDRDCESGESFLGKGSLTVLIEKLSGAVAINPDITVQP